MDATAEEALIVQSDLSVLLETGSPRFPAIRDGLGRFADLIKSPEYMHTYKITPLSLWNAASSGMTAEQVVAFLDKHSKYPLPPVVASEIAALMGRYGAVRMETDGDLLRLSSAREGLIDRLAEKKTIRPLVAGRPDADSMTVSPLHRGWIKQELTRLGFPVHDEVGYARGESLEIRLRETMRGGRPFRLRAYQREAVDAFYREAGGAPQQGSGVLVLPCGAGKTVIGIAAMARLACATLILTTNVTSVRQWKRELLDKTGLDERDIGEYTGASKEVRPVTVATYQILTHRGTKQDEFVHMRLFNERDWGLIIYDEVHLLPAPVFRATADIQAARRLGLTATLVREDGREKDVFSLIGPKRYDASWRELESDGWIAKAECVEVRVPLPAGERTRYLREEGRVKHRIAGENPEKITVVRRLLDQHRDEPAIVIGQYVRQLETLARELKAPVVTGKMPHDERERVYEQFRKGELRRIVVSKVANFAVDLPDASVAIQVSGSFGSRQEEAQRLGRILRPKDAGRSAFFYSLVSAGTSEQEFALNRQLFLTEQGYRYRVEEAVTR